MNDNTYFKAEVLGYDARTDLAVLKVHSNKDLPLLHLVILIQQGLAIQLLQ
nr:S1C family serine protease [Rickettsia endosymbiont of Ceutorhynchus assimilis]